MLSRWTNFLTEDGEKPSRERDAEFENVINTREEMMEKWNAGWECFFKALEQPVFLKYFYFIFYISKEPSNSYGCH